MANSNWWFEVRKSFESLLCEAVLSERNATNIPDDSTFSNTVVLQTHSEIA